MTPILPSWTNDISGVHSSADGINRGLLMLHTAVFFFATCWRARTVVAYPHILGWATMNLSYPTRELFTGLGEGALS